MSELIKIESIKTPENPKSWDYEKSIKKVGGLQYKAKNLDAAMAKELWIAREQLSKDGVRKRSALGGPKGPPKTWADYCEDIGATKRKVNKWLKAWFPPVIEDEPSVEDESIEELNNKKKTKMHKKQAKVIANLKLGVAKNMTKDDLKDELGFSDTTATRYATIIQKASKDELESIYNGELSMGNAYENLKNEPESIRRFRVATEVIGKNPLISTSELAEKVGVRTNTAYSYKVVHSFATKDNIDKILSGELKMSEVLKNREKYGYALEFLSKAEENIIEKLKAGSTIMVDFWMDTLFTKTVMNYLIKEEKTLNIKIQKYTS